MGQCVIILLSGVAYVHANKRPYRPNVNAAIQAGGGAENSSHKM